jgi:hypothetical protein
MLKTTLGNCIENYFNCKLQTSILCIQRNYVFLIFPMQLASSNHYILFDLINFICHNYIIANENDET